MKLIHGKNKAGEITFTLGYDRNGRASFMRETNGLCWYSSDGNNWTACSSNCPDNTHRQDCQIWNWTGTARIDNEDNLIKESDNGDRFIRKPDGTKISEFRSDEYGTRRKIVKRTDGSSQTTTYSTNGSEVIDRDAGGRESKRLIFDRDGKILKQEAAASATQKFFSNIYH